MRTDEEQQEGIPESLVELWRQFFQSEWIEGMSPERSLDDPEEAIVTSLKHAADTVTRVSSDVHLSEVTQILDLGCSAGAKALSFARSYPEKQVVGLEPHLKALRVGEEFARHYDLPNLSFLQGTGEQLPFRSESIDLVFSETVLEHVLDPNMVIDEIARVLRPGGTAYIDCPNYIWPWEPHLRIFCLPLLGKPLVKLCAYLQGKGATVDYLDHLKFVTAHGVIRRFSRHGFSITNRVQTKFEAIVAGDLSVVKQYTGSAQLLRMLSRIGLATPLIRLAMKLGFYPSILLTARKSLESSSLD